MQTYKQNIQIKYSHDSKVKTNKEDKVKPRKIVCKILCYKLKNKKIYKIKTKLKAQRFKTCDRKLGYIEKSSGIKLIALWNNEELVFSVLSFYGD